MERLHRKISYLEGLAGGLNLSADQKEGRVLLEMIQLCKAMADRIEEIEARLDEQEEYLEAIDEDIVDLEHYLFGTEEDDAEDEGETGLTAEEAFEGKVTGYYEIECPHCGEMVLVDEEDYEDEGVVELICPECEETIVLEEMKDGGTEGGEYRDQPEESGNKHLYTS